MDAFRVSEGDLYEYNKGFLYRYNDHVSKLTVCSRVRKKGYEAADGSKPYTPKGDGGNEEKLPRNVRRAKSKVFEYAMCNEFDFFCTLTFSPDKVQARVLLVRVARLKSLRSTSLARASTRIT